MEGREREKKEYVCSYRVGLERKKIVIERKRERERERQRECERERESERYCR